MLGASYLVIGQMSNVGGRNQLQFELYDVLSQRKVFQKQVAGTDSQLRDIAHAVSDAVYEAITGIRGAFSTKILYVEDLKRAGAGRSRPSSASSGSTMVGVVAMVVHAVPSEL